MSYYWRYVLWLIAVIGLVVVLIMLLLPGNHKTISGNQFISYSSSNSVASLIIDAPENANSTHQAVKISVSQNSVVYQQLSTYKYNVVNHQSFVDAAEQIGMHGIVYECLDQLKQSLSSAINR